MGYLTTQMLVSDFRKPREQPIGWEVGGTTTGQLRCDQRGVLVLSSVAIDFRLSNLKMGIRRGGGIRQPRR